MLIQNMYFAWKKYIHRKSETTVSYFSCKE